MLVKSLRLQSIARPRIRNLVRGIISSADHASTKDVMNSLRREAKPSEIGLATEIILSSPTGLKLFSPRLAASSLEEIQQRPFYDTARIDVEIAIQIAKLKLNQDDVIDAIRKLREIDDAFFSGDASEFSRHVAEHVETFGLSLSVMRRAISSRYTRISTAQSYDISTITRVFLGSRRNIVAAALDEACDWERSYAEVRRKYVNLVSSGRIKGSSAHLVLDLFNLEKNDISDALQAHGRWSALDICEFLCWIRRRLATTPEILDQIKLPDKVESAFRECFSQARLDDLLDMVTDEVDFQDYKSLPHLPAWRQYEDIADFKISIESRLSDRLSGTFPARRWPKEISSVSTPSLADLAADWRKRPRRGGKQGMLYRTLKLLPHLIEPEPETVTDGELLLHILNNTVDVALLTSTEEIKRCWKPSTNDQLYNYLRCAILWDADGGGLSRHAFRRALQILVAERFDGSILKLFIHLDTDARHVSEHLFGQCTESFLTELYHIYPTSEDVINSQIELYEHYGATRKNSGATDIARAQKLNLRLRRVRGALDDTRLFVDPLKFVQWGLENLSPTLRDFADVKHLLNTSTPTPIATSAELATLEDSRSRLSSVLNAAFREFCENKFYGIESYVGRRIRHGTLVGMLVDELRPEVEACVRDCEYRAPNFSSYLKNWLAALDSKVRVFGEKYLYVRTKDKPDGIIISNGDGPEKRAVLQTMERRVLSVLEPNQPVSQAVAVIYEYCWQLVEFDLSRARSHIIAIASSSIIDPSDHISNLSDGPSDLVMKCCRHLNTALRTRCETLSSWLTRPSSTSPSASFDQIFQVVLEEVFARYPASKPDIQYSGSTSLDVFGHRFHAIYDILYILVDNAARHGLPNGVLRFSVETVSVSPEIRTVRMSLKSDITSSSFDDTKLSIETALNGDLDNALITEGRSGIRKIRRLVQEYSEFNRFSVNFDEKSVEFSVDIFLHG